MTLRLPLAVLLVSVLLLAGHVDAQATGDDLPECSLNRLRTFYNGDSARQCARASGFGSPFHLLRAPPTAAQLLAICRSSACATLFNDEVGTEASSGGDCRLLTGDKMRLYADLVSIVRTRCVDMSDAYVLVDCVATTARSNTTSEVWYFSDSLNVSAVPDPAQRLGVTSASAGALAAWEGDEVTATGARTQVFAYIEDTGRREATGRFAGVLDAVQRGASRAYDCHRADDGAYPLTNDARCERRYICTTASE